jgi:hypothetical protein
MISINELLIPIAVFALLFGVFYLYINARHKQRMALIEKGADASIFFSDKPRASGKYWTLRLGMFFSGLAIGTLLGFLLTLLGVVEPVAYLSMIFLWGGLGLILFYILFKDVK